MLVLLVTMAVNPEVLDVMLFLFVICHGFSAFRTSELNPSCSKSSFPGVCEVVVTTVVTTLYYVITQIAYLVV